MDIDIKLVTVITTALVDSINPCAIGVLVLLISTLLSLSKERRKMLWVGILYIAMVYITYFLAGLGLMYFIQRLNLANTVGIVVGIFVIILGMIEIKDFFWYGKGISLAIPKSQIARLKKYANHVTISGIIVLGIFAAAVELPCTGGPYLAITTILAKDFQWIALWYLAIYNAIFVLPLVVILGIAYGTHRITQVEEWKMKYRSWMRLGTGLILLALGIILILYARGDISLAALE